MQLNSWVFMETYSMHVRRTLVAPCANLPQHDTIAVHICRAAAHAVAPLTRAQTWSSWSSHVVQYAGCTTTTGQRLAAVPDTVDHAPTLREHLSPMSSSGAAYATASSQSYTSGVRAVQTALCLYRSR